MWMSLQKEKLIRLFWAGLWLLREFPYSVGFEFKSRFDEFTHHSAGRKEDELGEIEEGFEWEKGENLF